MPEISSALTRSVAGKEKVMKKVQLIHCPEKPTGMVEKAWYVPLNLLSIATYLRLDGHEVEMLDGQLMTAEEIAQKIDAEFVGFDLMHSSIESFDYLTKVARNKGAITIAGGHLATHLAKELLQENQDVDYVCKLGGEKAFSNLLNGKLHPNLAYRGAYGKNHVPKCGDLISVNLGDMPIPDRKIPGIDLKKYIANFNADVENSKLELPYQRATNTYLSRGCPYRASGQGCSFCSRADMVMSCRSAEQAWEEMKYLVDDFGIECIVDFSDTFVPLIHPLSRYVEKHGRPWKYLRIYAAVNEIARPGIIPLLKTLGVTTVLLGIESADEEVLRLNVAPQKVHTPKKVLAVTKALAKLGIRIAPAFVLGMQGESKRSIQKTLELNRELQKIGVETTYSNINTPFPGARAHLKLMQIRGMRKRFGGTYRLQVEQMQKAFVKNFTSAGWKRTQEARLELARDSSICSFEFVSPEK